MRFYRELVELDVDNYFIATYRLRSATNLAEAAWALAIGQSVGNPKVRNEWETDALFEAHSCLIVGREEDLRATSVGDLSIAFPIANTDWSTDGVSHLLCQVMGGHTDIDIVLECRLIDISFPQPVLKYFQGPKFGLTGIREFTKRYDKPLLGAIVKPKIGITPTQLLEMTRQLVDGGVDFIKEDEIMSNPLCAPIEQRVDLISNFLARQSRKVVFCHTVNCDPHVLEKRVRLVHELGGNGVHINIFAGFGSYNAIRQMDLPLFLHLQSSGIKMFTNPNQCYSIAWTVISKLIGMIGVDTIQTGMIGGYSSDDAREVKDCIGIQRRANVVPALSCGFHPGLVDFVTSHVGMDYLANVGGAIHGHPGGTTAGAVAMRQAIDGNGGREYVQAIEKWGYHPPVA